MKKIGIAVNKDKDVDYTHTKLIVGKLIEKGFEALVSHETKSGICLPATASETMFEDADFIICVGGDGTFLKAAREAYLYEKPVLGINKGSVGFLAEVETRDIESAIERLAQGTFTVQPRMVLDVSVIRDGKAVFQDIAINDAVVSRMALSRILRLQVDLDDKFVDSFPGDGIIVATPTGSTGYSLSAGGPIVQPDMRCMVISPICPHILYSRSFIASESKTVKVIIEDKYEINAMLTLDGQEGFKLEQGDLVCVTASRNNVYFASVSHVNFYDVLRAKIHGQCD
ncbi:MAG: NAD(+)/NADH kinase [Clostridia bacterium]|nr:NAD(+)/NADH kinase [Clostridia bacterium]